MKLALAFLLLASPALACPQGCEPPPAPPSHEPPVNPPIKDYGPKLDPVEGDSIYIPAEQVYFSVCTCDRLRVAWGLERLEVRKARAKEQCDIRRKRINCSPE